MFVAILRQLAAGMEAHRTFYAFALFGLHGCCPLG
jgi:hypothetical protein